MQTFYIIMERREERSASLWQKVTYTVYIRVAIIVVSILTLIAAAVALNTVLNREDTEESSGGWTDDLHAVTVGLIVAASATIIAETLFLPVAKWGHYIYAPVSLMHLCIVLADFLASCVLVPGSFGGAIASGAIVHQWITEGRDTQDRLFKAIAGSAIFGFLSAVLLAVQCIWNLCILYSLRKTYHSKQKTTNNNTAV